jgi:nicotinamidase-related amidase
MSRHKNILTASDAVLLIIDVQEAFRKYIPEFDLMTKNITTLIKGAQILNVPIVVTEQYPKGLGKTVEELFSAFGTVTSFEKNCFSCCGLEEFSDRLKQLGRKQVIVSGIEAHVCVNQTVHDLLHNGYESHLIVDAVYSRSPLNKEIALQKMFMAGAIPSTVECALFEMLVASGTAEFKVVQSLVK